MMIATRWDQLDERIWPLAHDCLEKRAPLGTFFRPFGSLAPPSLFAQTPNHFSPSPSPCPALLSASGSALEAGVL
jgi:hypothetical protein